MKIYVTDGNVERALRKLSKKISDVGLLTEVRERGMYVKPSIERKVKAKAARKRWNKHLSSQQLPKRMY